MKKKKVVSTEEADSERKIFTAFSNDDLHHYQWDQKLKLGPACQSIDCPFKFSTPVDQILEALKDNSTLRSITFINRPWNQLELNELVDCLTNHNTGVTTIIFSGLPLTSIVIEAFVRIFKRNPRITTVKFISYINGIPENIARFCDGLEYYNIKSLELEHVVDQEQFRILARGLQYNQTLTELSITNQILPNSAMFEEICRTIQASPSISSFRFSTNRSGLSLDDHRALSKVIKSDRLQHLTLMTDRVDLQYLADALTSSTSITSLGFTTRQLDYGLLGEIIGANSHIKKLNLDRSLMTEKSVLELQLSTNTSLEELSLDSCGATSGETLFRELQSNSALKSLTFTHSLVFGVVGLQELLKVNTSLTELILPAQAYNEPDTCMFIANGLKNNTTLGKLTCHLVHQNHPAVMKFLQTVKVNTGLTHLSMGSDIMRLGILNRYGADVYSRMDLTLQDLVQTNKSLRYIEGTERFPGITDRLKENRIEQDTIITNTCILIKMVLMKPNSFILPIEVWSNIFKYVSFTFVPFNFEKFFNESMAR